MEQFIWYMSKGKEKTVYPLPAGSSEDGLRRLWAYAKTKEIRGEGGKLEKMIEKTAEKEKLSLEEARTFLWQNEKVHALYLKGVLPDMTYTSGDSVVVTDADLKDIKETAVNIDTILNGIQAECAEVEEENDAWKVFPNMYHGSKDLWYIGFYQSMKRWCTSKKLAFRSSAIEFMMVPIEEFTYMKNLHRDFRDEIQCLVWNYWTGDNMTVARDPDKYDKRTHTYDTIPKNEGTIEMLLKLDKDVKASSIYLSDEEARYLVDLYYQMQEYRKAAANQARILDSIPEQEPHELIKLVATNFLTIEKNIKACLDVYAASKPIGRWMMSILGIGPVISAGLMANIDIGKVNSAGAIQRFAGLDPTLPPNEKGVKRKYNARLKVLCWKIGESFIKVSNKEGDFYGAKFKKRREVETENDKAGLYAEQAKAIPLKKDFKKKEYEKIYLDGHLPPGHIISRARRFAVKLFLSHLFEVWYELYHGKKPPAPYAIAQLGHKDRIPVPNWH